MGTKRTDEFRADAVRIALTSGLTRKQVASDLGVGVSTLNKWITTHPLPGSACLHAREGTSPSFWPLKESSIYFLALTAPASSL